MVVRYRAGGNAHRYLVNPQRAMVHFLESHLPLDGVVVSVQCPEYNQLGRVQLGRQQRSSLFVPAETSEGRRSSCALAV